MTFGSRVGERAFEAGPLKENLRIKFGLLRP